MFVDARWYASLSFVVVCCVLFDMCCMWLIIGRCWLFVVGAV